MIQQLCAEKAMSQGRERSCLPQAPLWFFMFYGDQESPFTHDGCHFDQFGVSLTPIFW